MSINKHKLQVLRDGLSSVVWLGGIVAGATLMAKLGWMFVVFVWGLPDLVVGWFR